MRKDRHRICKGAEVYAGNREFGQTLCLSDFMTLSCCSTGEKNRIEADKEAASGEMQLPAFCRYIHSRKRPGVTRNVLDHI